MQTLRPKPTENDAKDLVPIRKQFRYKTWRPPCDTKNAMRVDEALDQIGLALFPKEWGLQPDFDLLPLFWRKHKSGIFGLVPHGKKAFKKVDVEVPTESIADLQAQFSEAYRTLRSGLRKKIRAKSVSDDGSRLLLRSEMMITQYVAVFGAGTIYLQRSRRRVWINKKEFQKWLRESVVPERSLPTDTRNRATDHLKEALSGLVLKSINRRQIAEFLTSWLKVRPTKNDVETILEHLPKGARRGGKPLSDATWTPVLNSLVESMEAKATGPQKSL